MTSKATISLGLFRIPSSFIQGQKALMFFPGVIAPEGRLYPKESQISMTGQK
jgi:hypothetical protein